MMAGDRRAALGRSSEPFGLGAADREVIALHPGIGLDEPGEILGAHVALFEGDDDARAETLGECAVEAAGERGIVDRRRRRFDDVDFGKHRARQAVGLAHAFSDVADALDQEGARRLVIGTDGKAEIGAIGNDVILGSRMEGADGDHTGQ